MTRGMQERLEGYGDSVRKVQLLELQAAEMARAGEPTAAVERELKLARVAVKLTRRQVQEIVARVEDARVRRVLELRYLKLLRWQAVADVLGYEKRWVMRLHRKGLEKAGDCRNLYSLLGC